MRRKRAAPTVVDGRASYALREDELEAQIDVVTCWRDAHPANTDVYAPREHQRVPKGGAWALIMRRLPPLERNLDEQLRPALVFWVEHMANADDEGFTPNGTYQVLCRSPFGDVVLWPYEYAVIRPEFLTDAWQRGELLFHPMATSEKPFSDILFYCLSRGISRGDAVVMALGTMSGPVGWFEPVPELAEWVAAWCRRFADVGVLTEENHERSAAAHRRRLKAG